MFDEDVILNSMRQSGVKVEDMPLGSVTVDRVVAALQILADVKAHLASGVDASRDAVWHAQLEHLSRMYFTKVRSRHFLTALDFLRR